MQNPFTCRGRIEDPALFWGRSEEIRDIKTRLATMQSVSIVGERRIGKSSLLYYFYKKGKEILGDNNNQYRFIYLTLEDARNRRLIPFLNRILREINGDEIPKEKDVIDALGEFADKIEAQNTEKPVVLLDEFDKFSKLREEFPPDFFDQMRTLLQSGQIAMVTSSQNPLQKFSIANEISPFFNIFKRVDLGEFTEKEKSGFVEHNWDEFNFTSEEIKLIDCLDEKHPIKLQAICYWMFENRNNLFTSEVLKEKIENEISSFFPSTTDKLLKFKRHIPCKADLKDLIDYYLKLKK